MACSKIFSGDLPELINEIFQYFHHDYKTLYSCIFVNRLWCRFAIPLLWEDPFSNECPKNYHFVEIYLHYLNDDDKILLNEYRINNDFFPSNTLFNYPSFIQHLNTRNIHNCILNWKYSSNSIQNIIEISRFTKLIYRLLFRIFIENKVNLLSFEVILVKNDEFESIEYSFELMLQNPNFICNIKILKFDFDISSEFITKFLLFLNSNCKSISSL